MWPPCAPTRPGHLLLPAAFPLSPWASLAMPHSPDRSLTLSRASPLLCSPSLSHGPSATVAADKHHRGHCLPLTPGQAPEARPVAPPRAHDRAAAMRLKTPPRSPPRSLTRQAS